jgi:hypothetical protein
VKTDEKKSTQSLMKQWQLVTDLCPFIFRLMAVFLWPDEETLRNMRASGLISHNDYRTRLGLSPMKD